MKYFYFSSILFTLVIMFGGCSHDDKQYKTPEDVLDPSNLTGNDIASNLELVPGNILDPSNLTGNDIASYLKLMPADTSNFSNPTGNEKLSSDIKKQIPCIKLWNNNLIKLLFFISFFNCTLK